MTTATFSAPITCDESSHYVVLGISSAATDEEIKRAYRSLVIKHHPDKTPTDCAPKQMIDAGHMTSLDNIDEEESIAAGDVQDSIDVHITRYELHKSPDSVAHGLKGPNQSPINQSVQEVKDDKNKSFHRIQAAYNVLRDPIRRQEYDASLQRMQEKETWASDGAIQVKLSEMEKELCSVLYDEESEEGVLQTVYFHECRCGHTFEIVEGDLLEESKSSRYQVHQCEDCSLSIKIIIDT